MLGPYCHDLGPIFTNTQPSRLVSRGYYWTRLSQNIVICQWRADQYLLKASAKYWIIDLRVTDKSRYFAITEFNNFIARSPSLFSYFNQFLAAQRSDLPFFSRERSSKYAWVEYYLHQAHSDGTTHQQTIICRSRGGLAATGKREKNASNDNTLYLQIFNRQNYIRYKIK